MLEVRRMGGVRQMLEGPARLPGPLQWPLEEACLPDAVICRKQEEVVGTTPASVDCDEGVNDISE